jgi:hypothetical protein
MTTMYAFNSAQIQSFRLDVIDVDEDFQPRVKGLNQEYIEHLMTTDPAHWPPLILTREPNCHKPSIVDGFHRYQAARRLGLTSIHAVEIPNLGYSDAVALNLGNGQALSRADRKEFAQWLRESDPALSLREIGRRCGLSDKTVKATLDVGAETPQTKRQPPEPVERLVDVVSRHGRIDVAAFTREIRLYEDDYRPELATEIAATGEAMVRAADRFLET